MTPSTSKAASIGNQFGVKRRLGQALYGSVYLCVDLTSGDNSPNSDSTSSDSTSSHNHSSHSNNSHTKLVAIKEVNLRDAKRRLSANPHMDNPWQERKIAEQLTALGRHDHILAFRDNFMENGAWYIVMEYCNGGDLLGVLQDQHDGRFAETTALQYLCQVAHAVAHLHAHGIAHRDLSLENVLLHDDVCKLSDFGLSTDADRVCTERVGKAYYMAPEVVAEQAYDARAADMWSLGIMLFIMLTGSPLVQIASAQDKAFMALRTHGLAKILGVWDMASCVSADSLMLLESLLSVDPAQRPTIEQLLKHRAMSCI